MTGLGFPAVRLAQLGPCLIIAACLSACAGLSPAEPSLKAQLTGRYVSMGSSFAAGPGITTSADATPSRCSRSRDNYANQLMRKRGLDLVDVSCSGATTAHVLGSWNELAPQIDAVTVDTRLVTVTIGGNDVSYIRNLMAYSCPRVTGASKNAPNGQCPTVNLPSQADWDRLDLGLDRIAAGVRRRAPQARLIFIQYVQPLPSEAGCQGVPLTQDEISTVRGIGNRLSAATRAAGRRWNADVVNPVPVGSEHSPCSAEPWTTGFPQAGEAGFMPYHPNLAGMTAVADRLDHLLDGR